MSGAVFTGPAQWLSANALRTPETICLRDPAVGTTLTFKMLNERVRRLAAGLQARFETTELKVAILSVDRHEFVECILACCALGATYVALNPRLTLSEMQSQLRQAQVHVLFYSAEYRGTADALSELMATGTTVQFGDAGGEYEYEALLNVGKVVELPEPNPEAIVSIAFTSGTTGTPKGVAQSLRMLTAISTSLLVDYAFDQDEFRYVSAPLFHISGAAYLLCGIARGFTSLILPQFKVDAVKKYLLAPDGLTGCFLVPTMLSALLEDSEIAQANFPRLRSIGYGAAPMTPALLKRAMDTFDCDFINSFGAGTEAGCQSVLTAADHRRAASGQAHLLASIGRAAFGVELRICDEELLDVAVGDVGEIVTRSAMSMSGYLGEHGDSARTLAGGWLRAGDLARMDADGYIYLAGRRSDMIIRGGENVYPIEVEAALAGHPDVIEAAVLGVPDDHWGEVVHAFVVMRTARSDGPELDRFVSDRLARYKRPDRYHFVESLPKNAAGKTLKRELSRQLRRLNESQ